MDLFSPLETVSNAQLQTLGMVLWGWELPCTAQRLTRLSRFFEYYREIYSSYVPEILAGPNAVAIRPHEDIFDIIRTIKIDTGIPRAELTKYHFAKRGGNKDAIPPTLDQNRAFNIAVSVMVMISSSSDRHESLLELGTRPISWQDDMTFSEFLERALPKTNHLLLNDPKSSEAATAIKAAISARKLKKKAGIRFIPTDDLREHLHLDRKAGMVRVYHHTAFVKECLIASRSVAASLPDMQSTQSANIPRQLALEILDTLQLVLFPSDNYSLLRSLVSKEGFYPSCLHFESAPYRSEDEMETYHYFGQRLMDLYEELQNPTPRGPVEKWLERRSGARYVMMATLFGVIIAVILGLLGLAVAIFQAWVAWQQWKHPIQSG
ncbi:hypothetical protein EV356DRAFT_578886 [Viridothelium virens]|uniref:Uncharacterized protein n=1 Tax=Viridothelium virens TaxID=1048519 RepID=A0A6A6H2N2_VIRVR|nr:hypothetical protein EV356DRAFT_578886 [Viridothelium virens]